MAWLNICEDLYDGYLYQPTTYKFKNSYWYFSEFEYAKFCFY